MSQTPSRSDTPRAGWTRTRYGGTGTTVPVEAISIQNVGHSLPLGGQALMALQFFGLTGAPPSPAPSSPAPSSPAPSSPPPTQVPPAACRVTYTVNAWNTGLTTDIRIANSGTATVNGWALGFTLPGGQTITSGWNATYSPTSGPVTARNVGYNGTIPPGGATNIGFQATHTGNPARPAAFTLNGSVCSVG